MDEDRENQIEDHKQQQLKLKIIKSSDWNIGDDERKPAVIKTEIDDDNEENQIDQVHHHHHEISTTPPPLPRICEYCGKGFSSGKALGGHKRYHIQEARKYGLIIPRKTMKLKLKKHKVLYDDVHHGTSSPSPSSAKINSNSQQEEKEKSTCCLCQKEFPSKKSLFGHMRSHRDRDWRGIQPPPMMMSSDRSRSSSCSPPMAAAVATEMKQQQLDHDDVEDEAEDYYNQIENTSLEFTESRTFEPVEVLRTWCKTDKRGRKSIGDQVAAERLVSLSLGEQEQGEEQQQSLMMMKKIGSKISGYDSDDSYWLREDQELELDHHVDKQQHQHQQQWSVNVNVKKNVDYGSYQGRQHQPNDYDAVSNKRKMTTAKKDKFSYSEKRPRKSGGGVLEVNSLDGGGGGGVRKKPKTSFKCSSCGKSFPTFQALGGHRSSHNKDKHTNHPHTLAEDSAEVGIDGRAGAGNNKVQVKVDNVTSKSMYNEKIGNGGKSSSSQVDDQDQAALMTSEASQSSHTGPRKVLDFDLNETYVMEDDEEEGAN
ncbi:uncharacterized protein LOC107410437 [Ziziphus jujuba]|uniref:Uncharacterized protein LOC107410437 n=1 Tax=Ziziphus jujuba TaxID=326968 RepID=A0A6P3ZF23_ZIZJJ|nr:uncharacterized protein LOC107410437 [Ziziphus jujuba]